MILMYASALHMNIWLDVEKFTNPYHHSTDVTVRSVAKSREKKSSQSSGTNHFPIAVAPKGSPKHPWKELKNQTGMIVNIVTYCHLNMLGRLHNERIIKKVESAAIYSHNCQKVASCFVPSLAELTPIFAAHISIHTFQQHVGNWGPQP